MNSTATRYQAVAAELAAAADRVPPAAWGSASPCPGWSARDVLEHLVSTQRDYLAQHDLALGGLPDLAIDPAAGWRAHVAEVVGVLDDEEVPARAYPGYFGPTTLGADLEQFFVWDMLAHRWDIAAATGSDARFTDSELDAIEAGADSFGPTLNSDGVCGPPVEVSPTATGRPRSSAGWDVGFR